MGMGVTDAIAKLSRAVIAVGVVGAIALTTTLAAHPSSTATHWPAGDATPTFDTPEVIDIGLFAEVGSSTEPIPPRVWETLGAANYNIGFSTEHNWLRARFGLTEQPVAASPWMLALHSANIAEVEVWYHVDGELVFHEHSGTSVAFSARAVKNRNFTFLIPRRAGEQSLLVRVKSRANMAIKPQLMTARAWFDIESTHLLITALLLGVLATLFAYNAMVGALSREPVFLWFALTLAAALAWRVTNTGLGSQFVYPEYPQLHDLLMRISAGCYITGIVLLTRGLLNVPRWSPSLARLLAINAAMIVIVVAGPVFRYAPAVGLAVIATAPVLCAFTAVRAIVNRVPSSGIYLAGMVMALLGMTMTLTKTQGWLPMESLSLWAGDLTIIALGVITSGALANRLTTEKQTRLRAEQDAQAKSQFLANMSHEIRTPLNAIVGFAELLKEGTGLSGEQKRQAARIHRASGNLLGVINDVLDFSKLDADKMAIETQPIDFDLLCSDLDNLFSLQARRSGLEFRITRADNLPTAFLGDPVRVHQILANLLSNALKFSEHGRVELAINRASIPPRDSGEESLTFTVSDNGIGMESEHLERLFKPFEQADASTTRRFGGTGLGLTISHRLASLMDGSLTADSVPGQGSTFTLTLPLKAATANPQSDEPSTDFDPSLMRALVVEDNHTNQILVRSMLKRLGATCTIVSNGAEALSELDGARYDLVLMDCQMPVMDGYEATEKIRTRASWQDLPIIAMTANALEGDRERCLAAGMSDYVTKPLSLKTLSSVLERWASSAPDSHR